MREEIIEKNVKERKYNVIIYVKFGKVIFMVCDLKRLGKVYRIRFFLSIFVIVLFWWVKRMWILLLIC